MIRRSFSLVTSVLGFRQNGPTVNGIADRFAAAFLPDIAG